VEECGDTPNPTLGIEIGQTYTFSQADRSNYYHPVGFSYEPDGAHANKDELEPGVSRGTSGCDTTLTCPAPMYFVNGTYVGEYSNIEQVKELTGGENFGLDDYEPLFFHPIAEWTGLGLFSVQLRFDDATFDKDIFYFCHIHELMSGRIKLLNNGNFVNENADPVLGYTYDEPTGFDADCGTFMLNEFQLPHPECPDRFVCGADKVGGPFEKFASCIEAMNCHMTAGMTTGVSAQSEAALFIHQMIPHHQNAVNMAKALLKTGNLICGDLSDDESPDCVLEGILREIVNGQNFQIQSMRGVLETLEYPAVDDCTVEISQEESNSDVTTARLDVLASLASLVVPILAGF
jgi:hypothetical protein